MNFQTSYAENPCIPSGIPKLKVTLVSPITALTVADSFGSRVVATASGLLHLLCKAIRFVSAVCLSPSAEFREISALALPLSAELKAFTLLPSAKLYKSSRASSALEYRSLRPPSARSYESLRVSSAVT